LDGGAKEVTPGTKLGLYEILAPIGPTRTLDPNGVCGSVTREFTKPATRRGDKRTHKTLALSNK
jgi:hypothetical protein